MFMVSVSRKDLETGLTGIGMAILIILMALVGNKTMGLGMLGASNPFNAIFSDFPPPLLVKYEYYDESVPPITFSSRIFSL